MFPFHYHGLFIIIIIIIIIITIITIMVSFLLALRIVWKSM